MLWGAFHGACLVIEHAFDGRIGRRTPAWLRWVLVLHLVCSHGSCSAPPDLDVFARSSVGSSTGARRRCGRVPVVLVIAFVIGLQLLPPRRSRTRPLRIERLRPVVLGVGLAVLILLVGATVPSQGVPPFIYFQF